MWRKNNHTSASTICVSQNNRRGVLTFNFAENQLNWHHEDTIGYRHNLTSSFTQTHDKTIDNQSDLIFPSQYKNEKFEEVLSFMANIKDLIKTTLKKKHLAILSTLEFATCFFSLNLLSKFFSILTEFFLAAGCSHVIFSLHS